MQMRCDALSWLAAPAHRRQANIASPM